MAFKIVNLEDDLPTVVEANVVGRDGDKVYVGQEALDKAKVSEVKLTRPMKNCQIVNWADMKVLLLIIITWPFFKPLEGIYKF